MYYSQAQSRHKAIQGNIIRSLLRHFALLSLFIDSNSQLFFSHTRLYDAWAACDHTDIGRKTVAALKKITFLKSTFFMLRM